MDGKQQVGTTNLVLLKSSAIEIKFYFEINTRVCAKLKNGPFDCEILDSFNCYALHSYRYDNLWMAKIF